MNKKLKEAFHYIQAEEELKDKTKQFIFQKTKGYKEKTKGNYYHFAFLAGCILFFIFGGHWFYFTPTVEISIDINPSMELGVNRFGRVISAEGYNEDGQKLINSLNLKYMDYSEAVLEIIDSDYVTTLLLNEEIMTIAVTGKDEIQSSKVFSDIKSCTAGERNMYCYYAHKEEKEKAHETGLSYGKYKAFLEIQKRNPKITADEIKNMSMREIRDFIERLSSEEEKEEDVSRNKKGHGGQGNGKGYKRRQKNF